MKLTGNELSRKAIIEETDWNAVKWNGKDGDEWMNFTLTRYNHRSTSAID